MAPHSSTLAWKIPWMEEPGRLQSMGSLRVGHDWVISLSLFTCMHWRKKWQPTPVFLPPLLWINWLQVCRFISGLSILFHWSIFLFLCQHHTVTSWQIDGEIMEIVTNFIFLGSIITADGDCSHEIKRQALAPQKKNDDKPRQYIKK